MWVPERNTEDTPPEPLRSCNSTTANSCKGRSCLRKSGNKTHMKRDILPPSWRWALGCLLGASCVLLGASWCFLGAQAAQDSLKYIPSCS